MRKTLIQDAAATARDDEAGQNWLDVESLARVEVSSEDPAHPIDAALVPRREGGWRAGLAGPQTIRLVFDRPTTIRRIALAFDEPEVARTQEFALRWSPDTASPLRDVVRQQWNFTPSGSTREDESYRVDLAGVARLELHIVPDISGGPARATLARWRLG